MRLGAAFLFEFADDADTEGEESAAFCWYDRLASKQRGLDGGL
jgi:hypothetical protein